ncbi:MAG: peptidylprolyl isomerase [Candidatus Longimicrobiales bacterium M2_2A_002]
MKRYLALALTTLAATGCDAITAHTDVVARVGEHEMMVNEAVELMAPNPQIPAREEVVRSVVNLWVDLTIMASMGAEDSTYAQLDVEPLLQPYVQQQTFVQLREQVMTTDTVLTDEELRALYETEAPGVRVKARHILLAFPDDATEAQRDSVFALAEELRERAASGEDFSALAREYSEDQGTAQQGGDLGWFQRGSMVEPFENAAFSLEPGAVSEVVESPFGLHIIKVEDREAPSFDQAGEDFRSRMIEQRRQASLDEYVEAVRSEREMEIQEGAEEVARDLADDPSTPLQGRAASRELVTWDGGAVTAREMVRLFQGMPPRQRNQFAQASDQQMAQTLQDVATNEMIMTDAVERGITVPEEEQDSIRQLIREQVADMAQQAGLLGEPQEGETEAEAVERRVRSYLNGVLSGQAEILPLGSLSLVFRQHSDWRVFDAGINSVIEQLEEARGGGAEGGPQQGGPQPMGEAPQQGAPQPTGEAPQPQPADTGG